MVYFVKKLVDRILDKIGAKMNNLWGKWVIHLPLLPISVSSFEALSVLYTNFVTTFKATNLIQH
jgi:hypothetical protein